MVEFMSLDDFEKNYESPYFAAGVHDVRPGDLARLWPDRDGKVTYVDVMGDDVYLLAIDPLDEQEKEFTYKAGQKLTVRKPEPELKLVQ
jgi:hypothetical protein